MREAPYLSKQQQSLLLVLGIALGLTVILSRFEFQTIESWFYDFRINYGASLKADPRIVIVEIDQDTVDAFNESAPLPLDFHTRFLETLYDYHPLALGYLINMNAVSRENPELFQIDWGERFVQAADRLVQKGIPVLIGTAFDSNGEMVPPYPLSTLTHSAAAMTKDGNLFMDDNATRRALVSIFSKPSFHLRLTQMITGQHGFSPRGALSLPESESEYLFFRYHGQPDRSYVRYSFKDILYRKLPMDAFKDKVVIVGTRIHENPSDFTLVPLNLPSRRVSKLWVHANILDTFLNDAGIRVVPQTLVHLLTFALITLIAWWGVSFPPLFGAIATLGLTLAIFTLGLVLFKGLGTNNGIWLKEGQPIFGVLLGYYLVVPFRLMREHRKRWALQERNALLLQVEELKSNFLNLVTHDLKTPVARIQGLAEMVQRRHAGRLGEEDTNAFRQIFKSTDELNRFITGILELSKIESNRLSLQLEQKDVNSLVEAAAESLRPIASNKRIRLTLNLEPMFPIKIDPRLIQKVIVNVIDNAIKYSDDGKEVRVSTREVGERVEISVADEGIGMSAHEIENLFSRFYRAKNDSTATHKGHGLGLYLTKYFVEAHEGEVRVESAPGRGSVFSILLPIRLEEPAQAVPSGLPVSYPERSDTARTPKENPHV